MLNDKESPFTLNLIEGGLRLPVLRFSGHEGLNRPFRFEIEVVGLAPALAPATLLHRSAFLQLSESHGLHGTLHSASCEHRGAHRIGYSVVLVPHLQRLEQQPRRRVFTRLSVPDILERLLTEHRLPADGYRLDLTVGHYPPRPFCIQYDESDLALLHRLCEEEGIHYHFEHRPDGHVVVFADDSLNLPQSPIPVPFSPESEAQSPALSTLFLRHDAVMTQVSPTVRERGQPSNDDDAANHPVTGVIPLRGFPPSGQRHADQRSRRQLERQRCQYRCIQGRSDCTQLLSGHLLQVTDHPLGAFNEQWLITELRHQGQQPSILDPMSAPRRYHNDFTAQPWSTEFRPLLRQPRPSIPGYHPAQVLGSPGQPPQLDDLGRIAIRLWPALTQNTDSEGLWLAVALVGSGGRIAREALPRAGSEVWVSFLDSDPDRPILCLDVSQPRPARKKPEPHDDGLLLDWLLNRPSPSS
ncbi:MULTISPECIES: type VI secretion system Vgr family protein [unclassified Pseudomonas]|uniref:type VI secretion system Vgr family protein n=1 Tax=unclassified Pseudomonas TaxID=196821 RepID=UPI000A1E998A|nr:MULTISPECIES: type VI secretion system tip protein TssI/VgrG [unclassified Pseudomonas]MDI2143121.1 type VI secretion system tip protein VgrG [Pseudomonas sp. ITA]